MTLPPTSAPPKCDASSTGRAATDWGESALPCQATRGLRSLIDRTGETRYYCPAPDHQRTVERRFGRAEGCHICGRLAPILDGLFVRIDFGREIGVRAVCQICEDQAS